MTVKLMNASTGAVISTTVTDQNGNYLFINVAGRHLHRRRPQPARQQHRSPGAPDPDRALHRLAPASSLSRRRHRLRAHQSPASSAAPSGTTLNQSGPSARAEPGLPGVTVDLLDARNGRRSSPPRPPTRTATTPSPCPSRHALPISCRSPTPTTCSTTTPTARSAPTRARTTTTRRSPTRITLPRPARPTRPPTSATHRTSAAGRHHRQPGLGRDRPRRRLRAAQRRARHRGRHRRAARRPGPRHHRPP